MERTHVPRRLCSYLVTWWVPRSLLNSYGLTVAMYLGNTYMHGNVVGDTTWQYTSSVSPLPRGLHIIFANIGRGITDPYLKLSQRLKWKLQATRYLNRDVFGNNFTFCLTMRCFSDAVKTKNIDLNVLMMFEKRISLGFNNVPDKYSTYSI